jgi:hypothetical protein
MIEKLDNCPVCDQPLTQGGYDMQTCGTHFVAGKIRNHRKPSPVLPAERNPYAPNQLFDRELIRQHVGWIKIYLQTMTAENWKDTRDRIQAQSNELAKLLQD